ncbi:hypothetical protein HDU86_004823 [Geranomyces michiganensis]|nr:hypothetical protein HDU86_004823 [Geranomyces michiganensis]
MTVAHSPLTFADGAAYRIEDARASVAVSLPVPHSFDPRTRSGDKVDIRSQQLLVRVDGEDRIKGWLFAPIDPHKSIYDLQTDSRSGLRVLTIHLEKVPRNEFNMDDLMDMPTFPLLFASGFDTPAPLPKNAVLDDLDPHSVFLLGEFLLQRLRAAKRALEMYEKAARRGSVMACLKLAAWYHVGSEVEPAIPVAQDALAAHHYHQQAADLGHAEACLHVSYWFAPPTESTEPVSPRDTAPDYPAAIAYCEKARDCCVAHNAAKSDLVRIALWRAGNLLRAPANPEAATTANVKKAFECFSAVANDFEDPLSQWTVAIYHIWGFGTPQDVPGGVAVLRRARNADPLLGMPPGLEGLDDVGLDVLMQVEAQAREHTNAEPGKVLDVAGLLNITKEVVAAAGGADGAKEAIKAALDEVAMTVVKVKTIGDNNGQPASARKGKRSSKGALKRPTGVELAVGATFVAAAGIAIWIWVKGRRV